MKAKNKVVYVPPVYEDVQHEVTSVTGELVAKLSPKWYDNRTYNVKLHTNNTASYDDIYHELKAWEVQYICCENTQTTSPFFKWLLVIILCIQINWINLTNVTEK